MSPVVQTRRLQRTKRYLLTMYATTMNSVRMKQRTSTRLPSNLMPTTCLQVTWQRWRSCHLIHHSQKPHTTRTLRGSMFYRTRVIAGNRKFYLFCSCDLDLGPMTIDKLHPYCLEIYRMCKYELPTSSLSKVIVWQTETTEVIYHAAWLVVRNKQRAWSSHIIYSWR